MYVNDDPDSMFLLADSHLELIYRCSMKWLVITGMLLIQQLPQILDKKI